MVNKPLYSARLYIEDFRGKRPQRLPVWLVCAYERNAKKLSALKNILGCFISGSSCLNAMNRYTTSPPYSLILGSRSVGLSPAHTLLASQTLCGYITEPTTHVGLELRRQHDRAGCGSKSGSIKPRFLARARYIAPLILQGPEPPTTQKLKGRASALR